MVKDSAKLKYVDALRGIAVIFVVFHHTKEFVSSGPNLFFNQLINKSFIGVQLFYIVSAFTLFLSYQNRKQYEKHYIVNFFIRRFFRIAPMYYLAICFYLLWGETNETRLWLQSSEHITIGHILSNFFFVHQLNPSWINSVVPGGWSISIEMSFYLIIPLLFAFFNRIDKSIFLLTGSFYIMIVLNKILNYFPLTPDMHLNAAYAYFYLPSQFPVFAFGIILYHIINNKNLERPNLMFLIICLCGLGFTLSKFIIPIHITLGFLILLFCLLIEKYQPYIFVNKVLCKIGEASFGIYLFHYATFYLLRKIFIDLTFFQNSYINYIIVLFICLATTYLTSKILSILIEEPFIKIGKKLIIKKESKSSVQIS